MSLLKKTFKFIPLLILILTTGCATTQVSSLGASNSLSVSLSPHKEEIVKLVVSDTRSQQNGDKTTSRQEFLFKVGQWEQIKFGNLKELIPKTYSYLIDDQLIKLQLDRSCMGIRVFISYDKKVDRYKLRGVMCTRGRKSSLVVPLNLILKPNEEVEFYKETRL